MNLKMTQMASIDWNLVRVRTIQLQNIRSFKLSPSILALLKALLVVVGILEPRSGDKYPHLVKMHTASFINGKSINSWYYEIEDGHHRITLAALAGKKSIKARCWYGQVPRNKD